MKQNFSFAGMASALAALATLSAGLRADVDDHTGYTTNAAANAYTLAGSNTLNNSGTIEATGNGKWGVVISTGTGVVINTGLITTTGSSGYALRGNAGGTLDNSGTVLSTGSNSFGIYANNGKFSLTNTGAGLVKGESAGVSLDANTAGSTLFNSGSIVAALAASFGLRFNATLTGTNTGLIQGGANGIQVNNANAAGSTFLNSGTISGTAATASGISTGANMPIALTNATGGLVSGGRYGVSFGAGGGTIANAGIISGTAANGAGIAANGTLALANTGLVSGGLAGVAAGALDGVFLNTGTITATAAAGTGMDVAAGSLSGTNIGMVSGGDTGLRVVGDVTLANTGIVSGGSLGVRATSDDTLSTPGVIRATAAGGAGLYTTGKLTGTNTGVITGGSTGVWLNASAAAGSAVANSGTITGVAGSGLATANAAPIALANVAGGLVEGALYGVRFGTGGGAVTNAGVITGAGATGAGVTTTGTLALVNEPSGLVSGSYFGINITNSAANNSTIINSGTILGVTRAISTANGARITVTNSTSGLIQGANALFLYTGGAGITNSGTLLGTTGQAIYSTGMVALTNTTGGLVQGASAIYLTAATAAGSVITNSGVIIGANATSGRGVWTTAAATPITVTNEAAGLIRGGLHAIDFNTGGGTVANSGTILGAHAATGIGISSSGALTGTNSAGGLIQGGLAGVALTGAADNSTLANAGTIAGTAASSAGIAAAGTLALGNIGLVSGGTAGVVTGGGLALDNTGTVTGTGAGGVGVYAAGIFTGSNAEGAVIAGGSAGLVMSAGGTLVNAGLVSGADGWGVRVESGPALVQNAATGTIAGGVYAGGSTAIINDGLISGHGVYLSAASSLSGTGAVTSTGTALILGAGAFRDNDIALTGGLVGVYFENTGTLLNRGAIEGVTNYGVYAAGTVLVSNTTAAVITGGTTGLYLNTGGTVFNAGSITGGVTAGLATRNKTLLVNDASGIVQGGAVGVQLAASGAAGSIITNSGTISGTAATAAGVSTASNTPVAIENLASGLVSGGRYGMSLGTGGGTIANAGEITGLAAANGVGVATAGRVTGTTTGLIQGGQIGFDFSGASTAHSSLDNSGTISGVLATGGIGIRTFIASDTTTNTAVTLANRASGLVSGGRYGLSLSAGGTVFNAGAITGLAASNGIGIYAANQISVTNSTSGLIQGGQYGIQFNAAAAGSEIINSGAIAGLLAASGRGITASAPILLDNREGALVSGGQVAVFLAAGGTILNAGSITGPAAGGINVPNTAAPPVAALVNSGTITGNVNFAAAINSATNTVGGRIDGNLTLAGGTIWNAGVISGTIILSNGVLLAGGANVFTSAGVALTDATFHMGGLDQSLKSLSGAGSATVFYHADQAHPGTPAAAYATLTIGTLTGVTTHHLNVDLAGRRSDRLIVTGQAAGSHHFVLHRTTETAFDDPDGTYALALLELPAADTPGITAGEFPIGAHVYKLRKGDGGSLMPDPGAWYLSASDARSRAGNAIYMTAGVAGLDWHYSLDSLQRRIGDLRFASLPETGGVWVTANAYRLNASAALAGDGFEQDSYGITAGDDRRFDWPGRLRLLAGGFGAFERHERRFSNRGSGETSGGAIGAYASLLHANGAYLGLILRAGYNSNQLHAEGADGFVTDARYGSNPLGASLEIGRRVAKGGLWFEPSAQVAAVRLGSEDYDTDLHSAYSEPIHVRLDGATALQYRAQLRGGIDLGRWRPHLRVAEVKSATHGGALHVEGRDWTPGFDGFRFEAGLGVSWLVAPDTRLYFDYEYNQARTYERPWALTLGYRKNW